MARMKLTAFTFATFLGPEHFDGWSDDELAALGSADDFLAVVADRLDATGAVLAALYGIIHNRDTQEVWDDAAGDYREVPKDEHLHVVGEFATRDTGLTLANIAKALGMAENIIERPKKGRYAVDNMRAYLIHAKDADKALYDPSEVITHRGEDYVKLWRERKKAWDAGRAVKQHKVTIEDEAVLLEKIHAGELTLQQILLDDDMRRIYSHPTKGRAIDRALRVARDARIAVGTAALAAREFQTTVLFVQGHAGTGKTTLMNALCRYLHEAQGWRMPSKLAGRNALDDYDGGEVLFLDDVSAGAMNAEDWLHLMDAHNASHGSARYDNLAPLAPRLVIITSNKDPLEFFYFARGVGGGDRSEIVDNFFRRLTMHMVVVRPQDAGYLNTTIRTPERVAPYDLKAPGYNLRTGVTDWLHDLEWKLTDNEEPGMVYSPYGAAVRVHDLLARCNGWEFEEAGALAAEHDRLRGFIYQEFMPNGQPLENMPALPAPDSGELPDKTNKKLLEEQQREREAYEREVEEMVKEMLAERARRHKYEEWLFQFAYLEHIGEVPDEWRRGYYTRVTSEDGVSDYPLSDPDQRTRTHEEAWGTEDMRPLDYDQWRWCVRC